MSKRKYKFHPESLSYVQVSHTIRHTIGKILTYTLATLALAFVFTYTYSYFFDTPKERILKRENKQLAFYHEQITDKLDKIEKVLADLEQRDDNIYRALFEAEPVAKTIRAAGTGGGTSDRYEELENLNNGRIVEQTLQRMEEISASLMVQQASYNQFETVLAKKSAFLNAIPSIQPVHNPDLSRIASGFGNRIHPIYKIRKFHQGIDYTVPSGTEVYATGNGVVEEIDRSRRSNGIQLTIDHGYGYKTRYASLRETSVKLGQFVPRGHIIGLAGISGPTMAPHVHYEVMHNGRHVDPIYFMFLEMDPEKFRHAISLSERSGQSFD